MVQQPDLRADHQDAVSDRSPEGKEKPLSETIAFAVAGPLSPAEEKALKDRVEAYLQQHGREKTERLLYATYKALRQVRRRGLLDDEESRFRAEEQIHLLFEESIH